MKWTVVWKPEPEDALANLWTEAAPEDRPAITAAANLIDQRLGTSPDLAGESRAPGQRILFEVPLAVIFEIHEQDNTVVVTKVWRSRLRP